MTRGSYSQGHQLLLHCWQLRPCNWSRSKSGWNRPQLRYCRRYSLHLSCDLPPAGNCSGAAIRAGPGLGLIVDGYTTTSELVPDHVRELVVVGHAGLLSLQDERVHLHVAQLVRSEACDDSLQPLAWTFPELLLVQDVYPHVLELSTEAVRLLEVLAAPRLLPELDQALDLFQQGVSLLALQFRRGCEQAVGLDSGLNLIETRDTPLPAVFCLPLIRLVI
mmetsp:Transcript_40184/g.92989  ORF Transcript_40184/g.92989 Transcript_40184/m.92989 type:complete len:220 (-) Transcript_40184:189-848(-)